MTRADIENRLRRARWPEPAAELRDRVLAAAPVVRRPVRWVDRVWFSRTWRVAAAAAAAAAIVMNSIPDATDSTRFVPTPQAMAEAQAIDDAGREIGLPANVAAALARRTLLTGARPAAPEHWLALQAQEAEGDRR